ncbi:MAG TPA: hypothetical protein VLI39_19805 [Sedimentisphaerales bacterium]|nr:hypothetical protein [Sedimentisphaerales bacterium]
MPISLSGRRPAVEFVDEQNLAGDPRAGDASPAKTSYSNGWINAGLYYPLSIVIDLSSIHNLTDVCVFDMEGNGRLTVDVREGDAWSPLFVDELKEYRRWSSHKIVVSTRSLRLTFESPSALIGEVLLYGTAREPRPPLPQAQPHTQVLMESFIGINGFDKERTDEKPVAGGDPAEPGSYIAHASYLFQFAARYGSTRCDETLLKLKPGQPVRTGLGLVRHIENWNEPDKWWKNRASHFQPFELAAMCSADFDGHKGNLGPGVGVKNADPNMKLVLGGLARPEIEYLKAMKLWAQFHRNGDFPADVINLHHYSNDAGGQGGNPTAGISPEADGLRERVVHWRDRFLPGKEIWVSEFGYDTNPQSNQRAPAICQASAEEVQGRWIVRSHLALAASGVDRAHLYMLRDVNAASTTQYDSSGLTASKGNRHQPKRSWFYVATLRHVLRGTRFESEVPSGDAKVRIYRFRSGGHPSRDVYAVYAVWCPTSNATEVRDFSLELPNATTAALTTLDPQNPTGKSMPSTIAAGKVTLAVSESPAFVVTSVTSHEPQAR